MILGILKEPAGERRVALTPDAVTNLLKNGISTILVERGAGEQAFFKDAGYLQQGAQVVDSEEVLKKAQVVVSIQPPVLTTLQRLSPGQVLIGQFNPLTQPALVDMLLETKVTAFSLDLVPRSSRAQAMDVLSSMATVAGYKAVLVAAGQLPTFFPMFMTAAGTVKPAKVLVLGAGVAGLQAIATAKRLGAVVEAFDVRRAAREEVLSLGAKFVEVEGATDNSSAGGYAVEQSEDFKKRQSELIHQHALAADVVICTAQIPGRQAPLLLQRATVEQMKSGAVVVDLAAASGGNCAGSEDGKTVWINGVSIIGDSSLPASIPKDASIMFGKNVLNFLKLLVPKGELQLNFDDDILAAACITHQGEIISSRLKQPVS